MKEMQFAAVLFFTCFLALSDWAFAQSGGTINGRVTDPGDAVVPGAAVAVTNTNTGVTRRTTTNAVGIYSAPALQPGIYDVTVEMSGFASSVKQGVTLVTDTTLTLDFALQLAGTTERIVVTGEAPLLEITQATVARDLQVKEVQNLPMLNRSFAGLVTLVPGVRPAPTLTGNKVIFGSAISTSGSSGRNVQTNVDGLDGRDDMVGGVLFNYTIEGIQEFKLFAHEFGSQYGRTSGAVLQVTTKAGTNSLHGSAFAYGRNDAMTAIDYFAKQANNPKTPYDRRQFGGSFGGPIQKDRLFFFGAVERSQEDRSLSFPLKVFNEAVILAKVLPNLGIATGESAPSTNRDNLYTLKGDYHVSDRHALFVRWSHQLIDTVDLSRSATQPDLDPNLLDSARAYSLVASESWVIGNNSVNTFAFQFNQLKTDQTCDCGSPSPQWALRNLTFPTIAVGRLGSIFSTDQFWGQKKVQFKNDFSRQAGAHSLKVGGDFAFYPLMSIALNGAGAGIGGSGGMRFFHDPSVIVGSQAAWATAPDTCTTAPFVQGSTTACGPYRQGFLTPGAVQTINVGTFMLGGPPGDAKTLGAKKIGFYVQDDWKATPRLTLNLGLRYDLDINWYNQRELSNNRAYRALKAIGSPYGNLPKTPTKDFGPRVGLAWDIGGNGNSVLRASYGIFFEHMLPVAIFNVTNQSKPTLNNLGAGYVNSAVGVGQLATYVYGVSPLPPGPGLNATEVPPGRNTSSDWLSPNATDPYNQQFHVGYAHQLTANTVLSADFTHILGLHDFGTQHINPINNPLWNPAAPPCGTTGLPACQRLLAPAFQSVLGDAGILGTMLMVHMDNRSQFNEMIVHLQHRASRATFQASYTLSSANAFGGAIAGVVGGPTALPENQFQLFGPREWGPTPFDERHRVVLSGVFDLLWGIQASPVFQAASAAPYDLTAGSDLNGDGVTNDRYIDPATGKQVSVNSARGSATYNLDTRVTKFFNLGNETRKIGFFAEFYNITNRVNFGNSYNGNARAATFKQPIGYYAKGVAFPTSRQLQFGARFTF